MSSRSSEIATAIALALAVPATAHAEEKPPARPIYMLLCDKAGVPVQITFDGVVLDRSDTLEPSSMGAPLNGWLRPGKNAIRIQSLPGAKIARDGHLRCTVAKYLPGDIASTGDEPSPENTAAKFEWPGKGAKGGARAALDHTLELTLAEQDAPRCELWKRAEKLTLDASTRAAVLKIYQDLAAALRAGDAARVLEMHRFSGEDGYRCMGKEPRRWERDAGDAIRYEAKEMTKGKLQPWDPAKVQVELAAGGLVAVADPMVIVVEDGEDRSRSTYQPYVGKIDGKLVIVR